MKNSYYVIVKIVNFMLIDNIMPDLTLSRSVADLIIQVFDHGSYSVLLQRSTCLIEFSYRILVLDSRFSIDILLIRNTEDATRRKPDGREKMADHRYQQRIR